MRLAARSPSAIPPTPTLPRKGGGRNVIWASVGYPLLLDGGGSGWGCDNAKDFDLIQRLAPDGKVVYYSPIGPAGARSTPAPRTMATA
jgi:hypothetical protein